MLRRHGRSRPSVSPYFDLVSAFASALCSGFLARPSSTFPGSRNRANHGDNSVQHPPKSTFILTSQKHSAIHHSPSKPRSPWPGCCHPRSRSPCGMPVNGDLCGAFCTCRAVSRASCDGVCESLSVRACSTGSSLHFFGSRVLGLKSVSSSCAFLRAR